MVLPGAKLKVLAMLGKCFTTELQPILVLCETRSQAALKLTILQPQPPEWWVLGMSHTAYFSNCSQITKLINF